MSKKEKDILEYILNKRFDKELHAGYDPYDVDLFFDEVIQYIKSMSNDLKEKQVEIEKYKNEINSLKNELSAIQSRYNTLKTDHDKLIDDGYGSQKLIKDMSNLQERFAKIQNNED